jgi:hypothetical protein
MKTTMTSAIDGGTVLVTSSRASSGIVGFDRRRAIVIPGIAMKLVMLIHALSTRVMRRIFTSVIGKLARQKRLGA